MPKISKKTNIFNVWKKNWINDYLMRGISGGNGENHLEEESVFMAEESELIEELTLIIVSSKYIRFGCPFVHHSVPKSHFFVSSVLSNLDEGRFKQIVRVNWSSFQYIIDLIKDHKVFNGPRSCKQFSVEMQLAIVLYRLGSSGEGATYTKIASLFGISDGGVIQDITHRVFTALEELKDEFLSWPDAAERKELVAETLHELPHCIGYVDGTEIKLSEKPLQDPEAYFSRKHMYSLKVQAVSDYKLRIRHMVLGYPGSVHDARIYKNCCLFLKSREMLSGAEWLAGDSAYKLTPTLITPFRENSTAANATEKNAFNRLFSQYRIRIEHCFGLLKERFNSLKELKLQIRNRSSIELACRWILVCGILHNILIKQNDNNFREEHNTTECESEILSPGINDDDAFETIDGVAKRNALLSIILQT